MARFLRFYLFAFLLIFNTISVFSGLPPKTMIFLGNGMYTQVQHLEVGDEIPIYNPATHRLEPVKRRIQEISTSKTKHLISIETENHGILTVDKEQKLYNRRIKKFIPAQEFEVGDMLFAPEKGNLLVTEVYDDTIEEKETLYEVEMENGKLFLVLNDQKEHVLVRSPASTVPIFTAEFGLEIFKVCAEILVPTAIAALSLYIYSKISGKVIDGKVTQMKELAKSKTSNANQQKITQSQNKEKQRS